MAPKDVADQDRETFEKLKEVRAAALHHYLLAQELSRQRRSLILSLVDCGYSQTDVARELGVTKQAVQKMLAVGR
jgi:DNA-binding NarL/FixJ family response regulator